MLQCGLKFRSYKLEHTRCLVWSGLIFDDRLTVWVSYKCMTGGDGHATTMNILEILSTYNWDAKAVLALAALAVGYGEFLACVSIIAIQPTALAKGIPALKQLQRSSSVMLLPPPSPSSTPSGVWSLQW